MDAADPAGSGSPRLGEPAPRPAAPPTDPAGQHPSVPRRLRLWIALSITTVLLVAAVLAGLVWSNLEAQRRLEEAQRLSASEQSVVDAAVAAASETAAKISERTAAYREAADQWSASEQVVAAWRNQDETPSVQAANPGGPALPGGDAEERALLERIGAADVQLIFDAGEQNCGFSGATGTASSLAIGGCYDPSFRDWLFLAWDRGITADQIWPIFVHEAMHWYQWEHHAVLFESASRAGVEGESYRGQIESDASCRAVYQHGIDAVAYQSSSSPCDVDGWYDGWLRDQLAGLGVPVAAPDPAAYEVAEVIRP